MRIEKSLKSIARYMLAAAVAVAAGPAALAEAGAAAENVAAADAGVSPMLRRLSPDQYRNIIKDVFGSTLELGGRFEPERREEGLLAIGASRISVSSAGIAQYDAMARTIAGQVVSEKYRKLLLSCEPASPTAADDVCVRRVLEDFGYLLYRRPMTESELGVRISAARDATNLTNDFYYGLSLAISALLESPQFLFRSAALERTPKGEYRLDPYATAAQLSFFFWNTGPDKALLEAATSGELNSNRGLQRQIDRLIASPRYEAGVRAFFSDMLHFDEYETLAKDAAIYPKFDAEIAEQSAEQTLRTIIDLVVTRRGDYRQVFTTKKTFMTPGLASVYRIPMASEAINGSPTDRWQPYTFPENDPRAGIHMQASFVALHSHPGRSSPTLRGKAIREILLCQKVPPPPGAVEFTIVQDETNPVYKTARARLTAHLTNPVCAGCHKITDPMGLALESFDGGGQFRTAENGVELDTSGALDGVAFENGAGLGKALHDNRAATSCIVNRLASYALGRVTQRSERPWLESLEKRFAAEGYRIPDLMRAIASSDEFRRAMPPDSTAVRNTISDRASQAQEH